MKIALTQLKSSENKDENLEIIKRKTKEAFEEKAKLVVFPEMFMFYAENMSLEEKYKNAEDINGNFVNNVRRLAKEYNIGIILGIHERVKNDIRTYNTIVTIDNEGNIVHIYRKTHLYDAFNYQESSRIIKGDNKLEPFDFMGFKIGLLVCYEVRFPEIARTLTLKGAEVLIIPSAWFKGYNKEDQWETLVKARSLENTVYVATSNQIGNVFTGFSMFVDPMGVVMARANEEDNTIIYGNLSKERIEKVRKILPLLLQRRRELYEL